MQLTALDYFRMDRSLAPQLTLWSAKHSHFWRKFCLFFPSILVMYLLAPDVTWFPQNKKTIGTTWRMWTPYMKVRIRNICKLKWKGHVKPTFCIVCALLKIIKHFFLKNNICILKQFEKLKNGNENLVGQVVLQLLIEIIFPCFDR